MYKSGDTIVIGDEAEFLKYIREQFAAGSTLYIQHSNGDVKSIKVRKL
jgi:hypothetical protein